MSDQNNVQTSVKVQIDALEKLNAEKKEELRRKKLLIQNLSEHLSGESHLGDSVLTPILTIRRKSSEVFHPAPRLGVSSYSVHRVRESFCFGFELTNCSDLVLSEVSCSVKRRNGASFPGDETAVLKCVQPYPLEAYPVSQIGPKSKRRVVVKFQGASPLDTVISMSCYAQLPGGTSGNYYARQLFPCTESENAFRNIVNLVDAPKIPLGSTSYSKEAFYSFAALHVAQKSCLTNLNVTEKEICDNRTFKPHVQIRPEGGIFLDSLEPGWMGLNGCRIIFSKRLAILYAWNENQLRMLREQLEAEFVLSDVIESPSSTSSWSAEDQKDPKEVLKQCLHREDGANFRDTVKYLMMKSLEDSQ